MKKRDNKNRVLREGETQRKDGMYMYRYTDRDGVRKTVYSWKLVESDRIPAGKRVCKALRDIEKELSEASDAGENRAGYDAPIEDITLDDVFDRYIEIRRDLKSTTKSNYRYAYDKYVRGRFGSRPIAEMRSSDIVRFYQKMADAGDSIFAIRLLSQIVKAVFDVAVMDGVVGVNAAGGAIKYVDGASGTESDKKRALTPDEQQCLLSFVRDPSNSSHKYCDIIEVLLGTGMRIGEALGLRASDCDFERGMISVNHALVYCRGADGHYAHRISTPKTKAGYRTIPMTSSVRSALLSAIERRNRVHETLPSGELEDIIFVGRNGQPIENSAFYHALQSVVSKCNRHEERAAMAAGRTPITVPKISPHTFRHTFCTRLYERGVDVKIIQSVMGHGSLSVTMDVYTDVSEQRLVSAISMFDQSSCGINVDNSLHQLKEPDFYTN